MTEAQAEQLLAILSGIHESLRILVEMAEQAAYRMESDEER
jgi:hypothetical protein